MVKYNQSINECTEWYNNQVCVTCSCCFQKRYGILRHITTNDQGLPTIHIYKTNEDMYHSITGDIVSHVYMQNIKKVNKIKNILICCLTSVDSAIWISKFINPLESVKFN
jgi:hypothetical protein